jgi:hypothetical protein
MTHSANRVFALRVATLASLLIRGIAETLALFSARQRIRRLH